MNQESPLIDDINQQVREIENIPELQDAFKNIEDLKNNVFNDNNILVEKDHDAYNEDEYSHKENIQTETENKAVNKPAKNDKYRKLQNDKYRALAEKEEAVRRAAELEEMLKESLNSGTYHYGKSAYAELEKAKETKRRAFEAGDMDSYLEADIALIKSINAINELEKWTKENELTQQKPSYNTTPVSNDDYSEVYEEIAKDWMDNHPYLQPNSKLYNPQLAGHITEFINELDNNLYRSNEADVIFTEEYFDTIDNYISSLNRPSRKDNSRHIESFSNVSGVRNSSLFNNENNSTPSNKIVLTSDEKLMADNAGLSHKDWLKYKLKQTNNRY